MLSKHYIMNPPLYDSCQLFSCAKIPPTTLGYKIDYHNNGFQNQIWQHNHECIVQGHKYQSQKSNPWP